MEKRRKALGVRKSYSIEIDKATSNPTQKTSANVKNESEGKMSQIHQKKSITPRKSKAVKDVALTRTTVTTPQQLTPKSHQKLLSLKAESPASPLSSPSQHAMVIHKMFGSPEVEVSWDWGCSQAVNEIVPVRRSSRANHSQPAAVTDSVILSYPRLPPNKQMSEEENQERLEFYKNILSKSLKRNKKNSPKNSNNIDKEVKANPNVNNTTPKRHLNHKTESNMKDEVNAYFDDSANEFMMECSQAIEEQLKNGEICVGSVINIDIGSKKHPHSPTEVPENVVKKICHGKTKQNLFPESTNTPDRNHNNKRPLSLKSPKVKPFTINSTCGKTLLRSIEINNTVQNDNEILFMKPTETNKPPLVNKFVECSNVNKNKRITLQDLAVNDKNNPVQSANSQRGCAPSVEINANLEEKKLLQQKICVNNKLVTSTNHNNINSRSNGSGNTFHYDSVNKFRRSQSCVLPKKNLKQQEPQGCDTSGKKPIVIANSACKASVKELSLTSNNAKGVPNVTSEGLVTVMKPKGVDVTSLLDDGFDMDLCSLDFDTLCCNSQGQLKEPQRQADLETVPKLCSEKEIESKRLAALNRLMMKKKK